MTKNEILRHLRNGPIKRADLGIPNSSLTSLVSQLRKDGHNIIWRKGVYELQSSLATPSNRTPRQKRRPAVIPTLGDRLKVSGLRLLSSNKVALLLTNSTNEWEAILLATPTWTDEALISSSLSTKDE